MATKVLAHFSPGRIIVFSLFATIFIGTLLLALPAARTQPINLLDLFFTATSATCVTGLTTIPLDAFTTFGHSIILILIQIGGLGLITLTIFLLSLFVNLGFATQLMAVKLLDLESWHNIKKLLMFIMALTFFFEFFGACAFLPILLSDYPFDQALFLSLFHSVASFCNAGVTLFSGGMDRYANNYIMLLLTAGLIIAGGLGFITWREIARYAKARWIRKRYGFSLNAKIIFYSTIILLAGSTLIIFALEQHHAFASMSTLQAVVNAFFHAATTRSAGLLTVPVSALQNATILILLINAFIGAAPASTGSGIKLTTFAVFLATVKTAIWGRTSVEIKGRSIPVEQVYKAIAIVSLSILWTVITTFLLLITDGHLGFYDLFFEAISAFATLGLSTGITPFLSPAGKLLIMTSMIIGRIGSLTLVLALRQLRSRRGESAEFSYPEERVLLS